MSLIKRSDAPGRRSQVQGPWTGLMDLQKTMNQLFSDLDFPWTNRFEQDFDFAPSCELLDTDKEYTVRFDVPGVKKDDISISLDNNRLTVSGQRKERKEEKSGKNYLSEIFYGNFTRSFVLPSEVKQDKIEADYADGVLSIHVPKASETAPKKIQIR